MRINDAKMASTKNIDGILNEAGLSVRQIIIQLNNICCFQLLLAYHTVLSYFTGAVPSWRCNNNSNSSEFCLQYSNRTIKQSDSVFQERCNLPRSEWRYAADSKYSFVTEFNLDCEHTYLAALTSSIFFVGMI